jgi:hypothetical protein
MEHLILSNILQQLIADSTPPLVVHTDTGTSITWILYKNQIVGNSIGYPILKVATVSGVGYSSDVITRGFMLDSVSFDPLIYDAALIAALTAVTTG